MFEKFNKKKASAIMMALAMSTSLLAGCNSNQQSNQPATTSTPSSTSNPASTEAAPNTSSGTATLNIAINQSPNVENYDTNYLTLLTERENDVDLTFELLPTNVSDARTKFSLLVTSNSALPDVLILGLEEIAIFDYGQKGIFRPLNQYYDDPAVGVNINQFVPEDKEYVMRNLTMPDGNIYSLFSFAQFHWNEGSWRAWINKEWTADLGLEYPRTTEELYDVLTAFVNQDPSKTGGRKAIGMIGGDGWAQNPIPFLMNAFTYANPDKRYLHVENGQVYVSYTKPEWREGLAYIRTLVADGLLDPASFTQTGEELKAIATQETAIAGIFPGGSFSLFNNTGPAAERMDLLAPLTGPNGASTTPRNPSMPTPTWYITKDCQDPELAFRVGDFFLSDEMSLTVQVGEKGVHWTDDPAVLEQWTGRYLDTPYYVSFPDLNPWGKPGNIIWGDGPRFERWEFRIGQNHVEKSQLETYKLGNWNQIHLAEYVPKFPTEVIGRLVYSPEEMDELALLQTAITEHVDTQLVAFVTGNRPLSDYDNFLTEVENLGLSRFLEISQNGYDRAQ